MEEKRRQGLRGAVVINNLRPGKVDYIVGAKKGLRKGYTTGTSAAAASKAAAVLLLTGKRPKEVEVALPRGGSLTIPVLKLKKKGATVLATVVKDGGDDPDVTDGAEIVVELTELDAGAGGVQGRGTSLKITGGHGVGRVTRPGLAIPPGKAAINPIPQKMIRRAIRDITSSISIDKKISLLLTVSVPKGIELAEKTMNARLGILGGISILGTTGIVEPMSLKAYRDSIVCAIDVAESSKTGTVIFSTGRSSEKAVEKFLGLAPELFVLTGDHMGFALETVAGRKAVKNVVVAGQFGKFTKLARGRFETHCSDAAVEMAFIAAIARSKNLPVKIIKRIEGANTAREVFIMLKKENRVEIIDAICDLVKKNSVRFIGKKEELRVFLVGYNGKIEAEA